VDPIAVAARAALNGHITRIASFIDLLQLKTPLEPISCADDWHPLPQGLWVVFGFAADRGRYERVVIGKHQGNGIQHVHGRPPPIGGSRSSEGRREQERPR
jgi:hypothetical protein